MDRLLKGFLILTTLGAFQTANGTALHEAVLCGKVEVVRLLLDAGSDLFMENDKGQKVDELLNGLNTSVAKQTKKMIQGKMIAIAGLYSGIDRILCRTYANNVGQSKHDLASIRVNHHRGLQQFL